MPEMRSRGIERGMVKEDNMEMKCVNCRFWLELSVDSALGRCVKNPPITTGSGLAAWPETHNQDWCGHHEMRVPVSNESGNENERIH